ncbi:MAG: hypothetical protein MUE41_01440 [Gemmatimonadaceae bacterium]|jgi:hypothetical protein|nr:hypothetical protein [Gemmatimonadaceae bacterium]
MQASRDAAAVSSETATQAAVAAGARPAVVPSTMTLGLDPLRVIDRPFALAVGLPFVTSWLALVVGTPALVVTALVAVATLAFTVHHCARSRLRLWESQVVTAMSFVVVWLFVPLLGALLTGLVFGTPSVGDAPPDVAWSVAAPLAVGYLLALGTAAWLALRRLRRRHGAALDALVAAHVHVTKGTWTVDGNVKPVDRDRAIALVWLGLAMVPIVALVVGRDVADVRAWLGVCLTPLLMAVLLGQVGAVVLPWESLRRLRAAERAAGVPLVFGDRAGLAAARQRSWLGRVARPR